MQSSKEDNQLYIGYDLNDSYVQISYLDFSLKEPKSLSTVIGGEQFLIPSVLCKRKGIGQWYHGEEAKRVAKRGEGILVEHLVELCRQTKSIEIDGEIFETIKLLSLFVKKTLKLLNTVGKVSQIQKFVFTVEELDDKTFQIMEELQENIQISKECFYIQDYKESFYYYTYSQSTQIWNNDVELFDIQDKKLVSYSMRRNNRTIPQVVTVEENIFGELTALDLGEESLSEEEITEKKGKIFERIIHTVFQKRVISSVYLIGEQFEQPWAQNALRLLCKGRRVFQGQNLYTKGACYAAYCLKQKISWNKVYLGKNKIRANIGMVVNNKGNQEYLSLISAGIAWYEAFGSCFIILDATSKVEIQIHPIQSAKKETKVFELDGLPKRPNRTTRLKIEISFKEWNVLSVIIKDMGFGEFYPSSNKVWSFTETL